MKSYLLDFYDVDDLFDDEERLVRDSMRAFVDKEVLPIIEDCYQAGRFPRELIPRVAALGALGASLPQEYGAAGLNSVAYGVLMRELERGDSGIRSFASVQGSLVMYPIYEFGAEEQRRRWLPLLASGEKIGCFGLTEPDHGSDPGGLVTRARETADAYVLNGAKMWITNGSMADVAVVWAKEEDGHGRIRGFLVEKGTPGFSAVETKRKHSLRASDTSELILDECKIPKENLLPKTKGLRSPLACLNQARFGIAWGVIGAAQACYDCALRYSQSRTQFGKPLAAFQLQQQKLTTMATEITKAQLLAWRLGRLKDEGRVTPAQISMAKRNNVYWALEIARIARDALGASGITSDYCPMRHANNLESVKTYEGTHDIHTLIVGESLSGIDAYS